MKKIFIVANANEKTGGPESLHQLCNNLNQLGYNAYMYYHNNPSAMPNKGFIKYNTKSSLLIEDSANNLIIVPETLTHVLSKYNKIKKCIWWLSLDFYLLQFPKNKTNFMINELHFSKYLYLMILIKNIIQKKRNIYDFKDGNTIFHLYNCEYIKEFLVSKGVDVHNMFYLCGPLSDAYFRNREIKKSNMVCYNPKKGYEFTKRIISTLPNSIQLVPLVNLTETQMIDTLAKSKLYIDFGYFPGPERIPREAVMLGCNVITAIDGSASNDEDIKIPRKFKFKKVDENIKEINSLICDMVINYSNYQPFYDAYRSKIIDQKVNFLNRIKEVMVVLEER